MSNISIIKKLSLRKMKKGNYVTKKFFLENFKSFKKKILKGAVFTYPTDTIYGIGCIATKKDAVAKIRMLKHRDRKPFSIIAPGKKWIKENFVIKHEEELKKLPGKFTFILELKKDSKIKIAKNISYSNKIGVRIPNSFISKLARDLGVPIVTTSVNISGKECMVDKSSNPFEKRVDFNIFTRKLLSSSSKVFDLTREKIIRLR